MNKAVSVETNRGFFHKASRRLRDIFSSLESGIDSSPWVPFVWLSVAYFIIVLSLSSIKLLWLDELITLHIARLGSISEIWNALV